MVTTKVTIEIDLAKCSSNHFVCCMRRQCRFMRPANLLKYEVFSRLYHNLENTYRRSHRKYNLHPVFVIWATKWSNILNIEFLLFECGFLSQNNTFASLLVIVLKIYQWEVLTGLHRTYESSYKFLHDISKRS